MLEAFVAAIIKALLSWLAARAERPVVGKDADRRADLLADIGRRVRQWEDSARQRGQSDQDRS